MSDLPSRTVPLAEVAAALGRSPDYVRRHHRRLTAAHGFPRPLPGAGWRWPRRLVEAWLTSGGIVAANDDALAARGGERGTRDRDGSSGATGAVDPAGTQDLIDEQRRALGARYGSM